LIQGIYYHEGSTNAIANQLIALERFETITGIADHSVVDPERPSPLSLHNKFSDYHTDSLTDREINKLIKLNIPSRTGLSVPEL